MSLLGTFLFSQAVLCASAGREPPFPSSPNLPVRGFNSWFAFDVHENETNVLSNAEGLVSTGLAAANYTLVALDGGWQGGRKNGIVYANSSTFPSGLLSLSRKIHALGLKFGAYTDRGPETCDGHVGSGGSEVADAEFYASIEADYLKEDSCFATQSHSGALAQFKLMQDSLAATGRPFTFSLCGWLKWYSGSAGTAGVGNSWRVGPDALNWPNVLMNMDAAADAAQFVGPGAFVDVDEIMGPSRGRPINPTRTLTQFAFIAVVGSPLLLSFDLTGRGVGDTEVAPFLNPEVLAVHWDGSPGGPSFERVAGGQLAPDRISPLTRLPCTSPATAWAFTPVNGGGGNASSSITGVFSSLPGGAPGLCLMAGAAWFGECNNAQGLWLGECGNSSSSSSGGVGGVEGSGGSISGGVIRDPSGPNCCSSTSIPGRNCTNQWLTLHPSNGTLTTPYWPGNNNAAGPYLTLDSPTPNSLFFEEAGAGGGTTAQRWSWNASTGRLVDGEGTCVGAAPRDFTNVWVRRLEGGDVAMLFINNNNNNNNNKEEEEGDGSGGAVWVGCDGDCCGRAGLGSNASVGVRDLFARTDNGTAWCGSSGSGGQGLGFMVPGGGASVFVRLHPLAA